jgi:site-specific DNA recombinase
MRIALYARVSTQRQAQADGIAQQLERLLAHAQAQGWAPSEETIFRDDGYSGASLKRPGLERLRDCAARRDLDRVLITAPDRLARHYVHQVLLLEELTATGCQVEFLDRPMSQDPHDQLLLQIRGIHPPRGAYRAWVKPAFDLTGVLSSAGKDRRRSAQWRSSPG